MYGKTMEIFHLLRKYNRLREERKSRGHYKHLNTSNRKLMLVQIKTCC
jgi:hypothetical protein